MMSSGTIVKACLVKDPNIIIDYTNFIIGFDSEDEAYYLMAYLNAPSVTKTVQFIQSEGAGGKGRHITKRPFLFKFPKFNPKNINHQNIVQKSKEMESKTKKIADNWIKSEKEKLKLNPKEENSLILRIRPYREHGLVTGTIKIIATSDNNYIYGNIFGIPIIGFFYCFNIILFRKII